MATQENERKSISRDLHDAVGQSMSAVQFELHGLAVALHPHDAHFRERVDAVRELLESSLAAALGWLPRELARPTDLRILTICRPICPKSTRPASSASCRKRSITCRSTPTPIPLKSPRARPIRGWR
ncbi:MAG: histidine kinase dimerization/phosphoacceptor domain-containing protein [Candidatus Solibacter sp.]